MLKTKIQQKSMQQRALAMDLTKQRKDYQREAKTKDTQYSTVNTEKSK